MIIRALPPMQEDEVCCDVSQARWTQKAVIVSDTGSPAQQGNSEEEWFMIVHVSALRQSYYP